MFELDEMQEDLRIARRNRIIYILAGIGVPVLGVILIVLYATRDELPALLMGIVAFIFGAILLNQSFKTRDLIGVLEHKIARKTEGEGLMEEAVADVNPEREVQEEEGGEGGEP